MSEQELEGIANALTSEKGETEASIKDRTFVSTGSTLLDLAISGGVRREGGIPSGILVELYGPPGCGKSSIMSEICANAENMGGNVLLADTEGRLSEEYCRIYGLKITPERYQRPDTIEELFEMVSKLSKDTNDNKLNVLGADSLSVLSTKREIETGDKMGALRAKTFSQEIRRSKSMLTRGNNLIICTNQARDDINNPSPYKKFTTAGGNAIKHQASIRIEMTPAGKLDMKKTINGVLHTNVYGVETSCKIVKNSVDAPYRSAMIDIVFDYGIDDLRSNLEYIKLMSKSNDYYNGYKIMAKAIESAEKNGPEYIMEIRERTIELWHEIRQAFAIDRLPKVRI